MAKRHIPPGARPKVAAIATSSTNHVEDSQRSPDDLVREQGSDVFTVKLEAATLYNHLPFEEVIESDNSDPNIQQFKFPFGEKELRQLMLWFREKGWKDQNAVLYFPKDLSKENRKRVHEIAQSFGLGTSSSGFGERRCVSVYSVEQATLGVGKIYLTKEEREKANEIWKLIKQEDDEKYKTFSHNEIEEMVLADKLDPLLVELWEKKESLKVEDIKEKCKVSDDKEKVNGSS
ncbi:uncharacterized protein [Montipora foliosa]|uniref:uncharacterized protein n=1 Tax=Montipora foliosa TaxID=591990 RepID=UPI0035F19D3A